MKNKSWKDAIGKLVELKAVDKNEAAIEIIQNNHWEEEYTEWEESGDRKYSSAMDFLMDVKQYVLA